MWFQQNVAASQTTNVTIAILQETLLIRSFHEIQLLIDLQAVVI